MEHRKPIPLFSNFSYFENLKVVGIKCILPKTCDSLFLATFIGKVFRCNRFVAIFEVLTTMLLKIYFLQDVPPSRLENTYRNFSNYFPHFDPGEEHNITLLNVGQYLAVSMA
jgi:hypothetical protein